MAERSAVKIHAATATDNRGQAVSVQPVDVSEPNRCRMLGGNWVFRRTHQEGGWRHARGHLAEVGIAAGAVFAGDVAGLNSNEANIEPGVAVPGKSQRASDVDKANERSFFQIISDRMPTAYLHLGFMTRNLAIFPGRRLGPRAALSGAGQAYLGLGSPGVGEENQSRERFN